MSAKIRPKKTHSQFFNMLPVAHHAVRFIQDNNQVLTVFDALQAPQPKLLFPANIKYEDFLSIINSVARQLGCYEDEGNEHPRELVIGVDVAYAVIKSAVDRALLSSNSRSDIISTILPVEMIVQNLANWALIDEPTNKNSGLSGAFSTIAAMSFRRERGNLSQFDEDKAKRQAVTACRRILDDECFMAAGSYFASSFQFRAATLMGARHGLSQALRRLDMQAPQEA